VVEKVQIENYSVSAVDYKGIYREKDNNESTYRKIISSLETFDPKTLSQRDEKIAFWINAYNIGAIKMIIDHYPVESIRSRKISWIKNPWDREIITIGGKKYSLKEIEHGILLGKYSEPMAHFAIVCASLSCPDLSKKVYRGEELKDRLIIQAQNFLLNKAKGLKIDREKKVVYFSQIFKFDKKSFPDATESAVPFIIRFIDKEDRKYLAQGNFKHKYLEYDWSLNALSRVK